ncbi:MAG: DUF4249 domain-containing protein [Flavobacteriaceae bacterium]
MKKVYYIFGILSLMLFSCEEVVQVDLDSAEPRLVVEASINWQKGDDGSVQKIRLTTTAGYYDQQVPTVSDALITVASQDGAVFDFIEESPGNYFCYDFVPEIGKSYELMISVNGEVYTATEKLYEVPEIQYIEQNNDIGFSDDFIEIKYFFQDNGEQENYYLDSFDSVDFLYPQYGIFNDNFFQGNMLYGIFLSDEIKAGDEIEIKLYGISSRYYNYMKVLFNSSDSAGPFPIPVGTVRGNLVNQTNPDNYALGYFRLSEVDRITYTIE